MRHKNSVHSFILCALIVMVLGAAQTVPAQTTIFAYQGKLDFDGVPANGNYDFQFRLFDAASGGVQQGDYEEQLNITVTNGAYTVNLDFGGTVFLSNANRFLEVSYRLTGSSTYTTLAPRQLVTTTPYSIHSAVANTAHGLDATCTSCVTSGQIQNVQGYQVTGNLSGSQISGPIPVASVPAGSGDYIQNTISQQPNSNFNIAGSGLVGGLLQGSLVNAKTQYNLGGGRVLSQPGSINLFVGSGTGDANTTGSANSFVGIGAGEFNTAGSENSFFGVAAGESNTSGGNNAFFGGIAGSKNTTGSRNSFFGHSTGFNNTTGSFNAFFGQAAGFNNTTGQFNSFFGYTAGQGNTTGVQNAFFGASTGQSNTTGQSNSFFGVGAGGNNQTANFNSFFGNRAGGSNTTGDNNSFFGLAAGLNNTSGAHNAFFGANAGQRNTTGGDNSFFGEFAGGENTTGTSNSFFGQTAGFANTTGISNSFFGLSAGTNNTTGNSNSFFGAAAGQFNKTGVGNTFIGHLADFNSSNPTGDNNTLLGRLANVNSGVSNSTAIGANAHATDSHTVVLGTDQEVVIIPGKLEVDTLGTAGNQQVCLNKQNRLAPCSSSLRYKTDLRPFAAGMAIIKSLQPVSFTWKDGGMRDLGFGAEDVQKIEPLLVTYNAQGQVEGVKYDRITVALVNAIKEQQQQQIAAQQSQIEDLRSMKAENADLKAQVAAMLLRLERIEKASRSRK